MTPCVCELLLNKTLKPYRAVNEGKVHHMRLLGNWLARKTLNLLLTVCGFESHQAHNVSGKLLALNRDIVV